MYDPNTKVGGCPPVESFDEAWKWNEEKWGIFWTVNEFNGPRIKENVVRVNSWAVDLDLGTKDEQRKKIRSMNFVPSEIVETARGHHLYFDAIDGDPENYRDIVERLVLAYDGDKNAKDICRILRVPAFMHWKNPDSPFAVKSIYTSNAKYTEIEMRKAFPVDEPEEVLFTQKTALRSAMRFQSDKDLWERVWSMDCKRALERLSGTAAVNHEMFSFKRNKSGYQILVNAKSTSCWIDSYNRIGSSDNGGPTIWNWINWYQRDHKRTYAVMRDIFPEVFE